MPESADASRSAAPLDPSPDGRVGRVVAGRYRIEALIGEGGMGEVYRARHLLLDKLVAIKILVDARAVPRAAERFFREAQATAKIGHPHIVDITDFGETEDGAVFIAMELLEGEDLADMLLRERRVPWPRARAMAVQICRALQAAHAQGIVHRDLKPENCFRIRRDGDPDYVKVLDFGIAKFLRPDSGRRRLTRTGAVFGTVEYMAPEQARGKEIDHRVDIYALGVILYELLTGRVPFDGEEWMEIAMKHVSEPVVPPSRILGPGVLPIGVDEVLGRALAKDPAQRYPTMTAFERALESVDETGLAPGHAPDALVVVAPPIVASVRTGHTTPAPQAAVGSGTVEVIAPMADGDLELPSFGGGRGRFVAVTVALLAGATLAAVLALGPGGGPSVDQGAEPDSATAPAPRVIGGAEPPASGRVAGDGSPRAEADTGDPALPQTAGEDEDADAGEAPPDDDARSRSRAKPAAGLDRRQIRATLAAAAPLVKACRGSALGGHPGDRVALQLEVEGATGRVAAARAVGSHRGTPLGDCVAAAVRGVRFPTFPRRKQRVTGAVTL